MNPARYVLLSLSLFLFWLVLSGHYEPLILSFGVFSCALVTYVAWRMDRADRFAFVVPLSFRFVGFLAWLIKEIFLANVNVARIILKPNMPISPIMVPFKATQKSELGRMIYANSITLTPGTITTGTDGNLFRIHALTWHDVDGREEDEMDRRITALDPRT
ncbi:MAG: cation transporter [Gemmatimonadales bacterium]|nr:MAG: cation transporter [Gemmatimonadales bacterium]